MPQLNAGDPVHSPIEFPFVMFEPIPSSISPSRIPLSQLDSHAKIVIFDNLNIKLLSDSKDCSGSPAFPVPEGRGGTELTGG